VYFLIVLLSRRKLVLYVIVICSRIFTKKTNSAGTGGIDEKDFLILAYLIGEAGSGEREAGGREQGVEPVTSNIIKIGNT